MIPTASVTSVHTPLCIAPVDCLGSVAHAVVGDATTSVFDSFASWLAAGAAWLVTHVANALSGPTEIDLSVGWFQSNYRIMLGIGIAIIAPMLAISTLGSVLRQDPKGLMRSWCVCLPLAVIGGAAALVLTSRALAITDAMTNMLDPNPSKTLTPALAQMIKMLKPATLTPSVPALVVAIAALVVVVGGIAIWLELVVRAASVYVALVFLPLALAGLVWPATGRAARRLIEVLAALILFKFVIVAVLVLGAGAVGSGGMDGLIKGGALLLMAAFAPFSLFRLFPLVEAGLVGHLEGMSRRPARAALSARSTPGASTAMNRLRSVAGAGGGGRGALPFFGEDSGGSDAGGPKSKGPDDGGPAGRDRSGGGPSSSGGGDAGATILAASTSGESVENSGGNTAADAGGDPVADVGGQGGATQVGPNNGRPAKRGWSAGSTSAASAGRGGGNPWRTTGRYEVPMARGGQLEDALAARQSGNSAGFIGSGFSGATATGPADGTTAEETTAGNSTAGNATAGNATAGNATAGNAPSGNATSGNASSGNATSGNAGVIDATVGASAAAQSAPARGSTLGSVLLREERQ